MDLTEFFKSNDVMSVNGIFYYGDKRKRSKNTKELVLWDYVPNIIKDVNDVQGLLREHGLSISKLDSPVLRDIIKEHIGCSRSWAKRVANAMYCIRAMAL